MQYYYDGRSLGSLSIGKANTGIAGTKGGVCKPAASWPFNGGAARSISRDTDGSEYTATVLFKGWANSGEWCKLEVGEFRSLTTKAGSRSSDKFLIHVGKNVVSLGHRVSDGTLKVKYWTDTSQWPFTRININTAGWIAVKIVIEQIPES